MSKSTKNKLLALSLTTAITLATGSAIASPSDELFSFGSPIVDAAESGNITKVQSLIDSGFNVNDKGEFGATPLMRAVFNDHEEIVKLLIHHGANPNIADIGGATALSIAAREGRSNITQLLLDAGANVNISDAEGITPLIRAQINDNSASAEIIAEAGSDTSREIRPVITAQTSASAADIVLDMSGGKLNPKSEMAMNSLSEEYKERNAARRLQLANAITPIKKMPLEEADFSIGSVSIPVKTEYFNEPAAEVAKPLVTSSVAPKTLTSLTLKAQSERTRQLLSKLERIMAEDIGSYEVAAADNSVYQAGGQYNILDLGNFKDEAFANKRIDDLKKKFPDIFADLPLKIVQKNNAYQVNAGIITDKAKAGEICKKMILAGTNCRPVETRLMTQDEFNQFKGDAPKPVEVAKTETAPARAPEMPERKDVLVAAPAPQVASRSLLEAPLPTPAAAPKPVEVANAEPMPALPPAPKPVEVAKVQPTPVIPPVAKAPPAPAVSNNVAAPLSLQEEERSVFDMFDNDAREKAPEPVVAQTKPPVPAFAPKEAAKLPSPQPVAAKPAPVEIASIEAKDQSTFKELKEMVSETPKEDRIEIIEKKDIATLAAKDGQVISETTKTEVTKTTVPVPPAPVLTEELLPLPAAPAANAPEPVVAEAPKPEMEMVVLQAPPPAPAPLAVKEISKPQLNQPVETAQVTKLAPPPSTMGNNVETAKFKVARPIKVTESYPAIATAQPLVAKLPAINITPQIISAPTPVSSPREIWARVNYFNDNDSARNFLNGVQNANPLLAGLRVRTMTPLNNYNKVSAEIGPFAEAATARNICDQLTAQGMSCSIRANIPVKYGDITSGNTNGRHSQRLNPIGRKYDYNSTHSYSPTSSVYQPVQPLPRHSLGEQDAKALGEYSTGWVLQFGSYESYDEAVASWKLISKDKDLRKLDNNIITENGKYRLRAGDFSTTDQAEGVCDKLRAQAVNCIIVKA